MSDIIYAPGHASLPVRAERHVQAGAAGSVGVILGRIEEAIDAETTAIRSDPQFDIRASNARKSRHLYELNRAMKGVSAHDLGATHRDDIIRLKEKLVANEAALLAHLNAVTEIAGLIQSAIQNAETDGTYSCGAGQHLGGL